MQNSMFHCKNWILHSNNHNLIKRIKNNDSTNAIAKPLDEDNAWWCSSNNMHLLVIIFLWVKKEKHNKTGKLLQQIQNNNNVNILIINAYNISD